MRTRIQFRVQLINFDADLDFYRMRIRMQIQVIKMQILADPYPDLNPQHCLKQSANCVFSVCSMMGGVFIFAIVFLHYKEEDVKKKAD